MRRRALAVALLAVLAVFLVLGVALVRTSTPRRPGATVAPGERGGASRHPSSSKPPTPRVPRRGASSGGFVAVPPATVVPPETPVQIDQDRALAAGLAASGSLSTARAATMPQPGFSSAWPALGRAEDPTTWTLAFVRELLDIDFAAQSRAGLGRWLVAESAPELLPGVPGSVANKVLYLSLFDTAALGGGPSPIPSPARWGLDASSRVRWSVAGLVVEPDPAWSAVLASGWQPSDLRFAVEDVSGRLVERTGREVVARRFSLTLYVGSARFHQGYGSVLVDNWQLS